MIRVYTRTSASGAKDLNHVSQSRLCDEEIDALRPVKCTGRASSVAFTRSQATNGSQSLVDDFPPLLLPLLPALECAAVDAAALNSTARPAKCCTESTSAQNAPGAAEPPEVALLLLPLDPVRLLLDLPSRLPLLLLVLPFRREEEEEEEGARLRRAPDKAPPSLLLLTVV